MTTDEPTTHQAEPPVPETLESEDLTVITPDAPGAGAVIGLSALSLPALTAIVANLVGNPVDVIPLHSPRAHNACAAWIAPEMMISLTLVLAVAVTLLLVSFLSLRTRHDA